MDKNGCHGVGGVSLSSIASVTARALDLLGIPASRVPQTIDILRRRRPSAGGDG